MEQEKIKDIEGYEGLYQITSYGRVISVDRYDRFNRRKGGEMKSCKCGSRRDYLFVNLYKNGKHKQYYIHQLVAKAFIPNPENKPCIDHIDNDKNNNHVENLRWVTYLENMNNTITRKRIIDESYKFISQAGADNPFSRKVAMYTLDGKLVKVFDSGGQIEKEYGIRSASISRVCLGKRPQTHGYVFKFVGEAKRKISRSNLFSQNRKPILQFDLQGNIIAEYESTMLAAEKTGFLAGNIGRAAKGIYKTYKGYKWQYK